MIIITLFYSAEYNVTNNAPALAGANLHGWRIAKNEVRRADEHGAGVHQLLTLVPIHEERVDSCPADLVMEVVLVARRQWGGFFALETLVSES